MNLNLDGSPITVEQHFRIAEEAGRDMDELRNALVGIHSQAMIRSFLSFENRAARFRLWTEGKLMLRTPRPTPPAPLNINADMEVFAFLVSTMKESA